MILDIEFSRWGLIRVDAFDQALVELLKSMKGTGSPANHAAGDLWIDSYEMSKIEAGQTTLARTKFDLHLLLDGVEEMIRPRAEKRGLQFIFDRGPGLPIIYRSCCGA